MIKVIGTEVFANNIVAEKEKFILVKKCKNHSNAVKFGVILANNQEKLIIEEEVEYELI